MRWRYDTGFSSQISDVYYDSFKKNFENSFSSFVENNLPTENPTISGNITNESNLFSENFKIPPVDFEVNGHEIKYNTEIPRKDPKKLKIHLIFHSHVDPGWLKTFEDYYVTETSKILKNTLEALYHYPSLRFIWSETSFLERWWQTASDIDKEKLKKLVKEGRLEITGGAWVMTDEATPLFYGAIENMIEGHQFIHQNLNIRPNTSWSVDPFGHGAMLPYLLPKSGIDYMVIGRFHEHIKQHMRLHQTLRWKWNDLYTNNNHTGPLVNSLPYFVYTTDSACPDTQVCACYHVGPSSRKECRTDRMVDLNETKIERLTKRFVNQIRRVQTLYGSENIMVAIGDDFFFQDIQDFDFMYAGFEAMVQHCKNHPELETEMQFSTVSDFFNSIKNEKVPSFRGDLFPYTSDRNAAYPWWTGYFTHRPFSKRMERNLQAYIRHFELLMHLKKSQNFNYNTVQQAKRNLLLYQHHDGITGTSTVPVMKDYEARMNQAFISWKGEISKILKVPLKLTVDELHPTPTSPSLNNNKKISLVVFNSNTFHRKSLMRIQTEELPVIKHGDEVIEYNYSPRNSIKGYEIEFEYNLQPFSMTVFKVEAGKKSENSTIVPPLLNFDKNGLPNGIRFENNLVVNFSVNFVRINDVGGAYTFDPNGTPQFLKIEKVEEEFGPIRYKRKITYTNGLVVFISNGKKLEDGIDIEALTSIEDGFSLMMAVDTDIKTEYYNTDINGLFHRKRKYSNSLDDKPLPYQANFYPVASSLFIEDDLYRLSLITGQSLSASMPGNGKLHLMMDRRLKGQDGKGLWFADAYDNRSTQVKYRFLLEKKTIQQTKDVAPALSVSASAHWNDVLYPATIFYSEEEVIDEILLPFEWPCALQLVSWRPISQKTSLLVLRRTVYDGLITHEYSCSAKLNNLYNYLSQRSSFLQHTSLSGTASGQNVTLESLEKSLEEPYSIVTLRLEDSF